jgi:hypothetical protein
MPVVDVNRDDFTNHQAAALGAGIEVENLMQLALEADGRLRTRRGCTSFEGADAILANSNSLMAAS